MLTLFKSPIIVADTETSGFVHHDWARVLELGAVCLDTDGTEIGRFESFVRPDILDERAAGALEVNHITAEMLADAPMPGAVVHNFREWLRFLGDPLLPDGPTPYCTTFNVAFDRAMMERMGIDGLRWATCVMLRSMDIMGPAGTLESLRQRDPRYDPARPWRFPRLAVAAEYFGVPVEGTPHRALTDARTAAGIAIAIRRKELEPQDLGPVPGRNE